MKKIFFLWILTTMIALGQLSPGDLHEVHKGLEGVENCLQCHIQREKGISRGKCLKCHDLLNQEIKAGKGFHSGKDVKSCEKCHIEHQGRKSKLIYWEKGKDNFNHQLTGYSLKGKHINVECSKCHNPQNILDKSLLEKNKKNLQKTFLGLSAECGTCHQDEHRGQTGKQCQSCHDEQEWKKAPNFDHQKTNYPLTGMHRKVECQKCHKKVTDNKYKENPDFIWIKPIKHSECFTCHTDIHKGKLGNRCSKCHFTKGWNFQKNTQFDHNQTKFPLVGKHHLVKCKQCHTPGKKITELKFKKCYYCHSDYHQGQLSKNKVQRDCNECHLETGFRPSVFTLEQHSKTEYPLNGSHKAVPCLLCHKKIQSRGEETLQFTFNSLKCSTCHNNVHKKQVDLWMKKGCETCHEVEGWDIIRYFDHSKTKFALEGKHRQVKCKKCHQTTDNNIWGPIYFKNQKRICEDCHADIHRGQFRIVGQKKIKCARCHQTADWKKLLFNHDNDSRFPLKGKHRSVECEKCHPLRELKGEIVRIYKPLRSECKDCHSKLDQL